MIDITKLKQILSILIDEITCGGDSPWSNKKVAQDLMNELEIKPKYLEQKDKL